jgi:hypothetical protein
MTKPHKREYKSGTEWCLWRWTEVDTGYITRLHIVKTPWFAVCLHWLNKPDPEPYQHDHPVSFISIILSGGYLEHRGFEYIYHAWFNFVRASEDDIHTIYAVELNTLTLCLMGPKTREWGFHTEHGWICWKDYYAQKRAKQLKGIKTW